MHSRTKTFLVLFLICIVPLLLIVLLGFLGNLKFAEKMLRTQLEAELVSAADRFESLKRDRERELQDLAASKTLQKFVTAAQKHSSSSVDGQPVSGSEQRLLRNNEIEDVKEAVTRLLLLQKFYTTIAAFSPDKSQLLVAEPPQQQGQGDIVFITEDFAPNQIQPDEAVWITSEHQPQCALKSQATIGKTLRCTAPIFVLEEKPGARGALVADIRLDSLISPIARSLNDSSFRISGPTSIPVTNVVVLDDSGTIVYHTNDALKYQQSDSSMSYFSPIANSMIAGEGGTKFYRSPDGDQWLAAYAPLLSGKLSLAVAGNYSAHAKPAIFFGWLSVGMALVLGLASAALLSTYYLRRTKSITRVTEGVGAIAKGKLDHRIELRSRDDLRPLADNLGVVTQQLREQLAREAESRQFQSFVRLSAVLTHDLKNAIEALSLIVTNMERHFDNPEFRADAMKSLTGATGKLKALVARLSNPVVTLSGEHKRPSPVDLVPMLKRVISMTAEPLREQYEIRVNLNEPIFALVDIERMEKVAENLIINALEAMAAKGGGTLTVAAGKTEDDKVFFSVSDTGEGMSKRFIEERLFHPFATTKRKGVGLGLYTCREVVRANGGSMQVESEEGAGTTFSVVLPSAPVEDAAKK